MGLLFCLYSVAPHTLRLQIVHYFRPNPALSVGESALKDAEKTAGRRQHNSPSNVLIHRQKAEMRNVGQQPLERRLVDSRNWSPKTNIAHLYTKVMCYSLWWGVGRETFSSQKPPSLKGDISEGRGFADTGGEG